MILLIPIICAVLFRAGGAWWGNKNLRWWMGVPIALIFANYDTPQTFILSRSLWCALTYWVATSAIPYGDNSWLSVLGRHGKWLIYGFVFGLASFPVLGLYAIPQAIFASIMFWGLMYLSNVGYWWNFRKYYLDHAWVEVLFGMCGTVFLTYA